MSYQVGDYLVHESNGICQIHEICDMELMGKDSKKTYYCMTPVFKPDAKVYTPVDGSAAKLRPVVSLEELNGMLSGISKIPVIDESNERVRQEKIKEILGEFTVDSLAKVVKTVLARKWTRIATGKKVMAIDEKILSMSGKRLFEEIAFVMSISVADAQKLFESNVKSDYENII